VFYGFFLSKFFGLRRDKVRNFNENFSSLLK